MKKIGVLAALAIALEAAPVAAESLLVGDEFEISRSYQTSHKSNDGSSGSSNGRDTVLERVIAIREDGLELEFDSPRDEPPEAKVRDWQFPARIFKPTNGPSQLLNGDELEARIEIWLKAANWTREVCGRWIFTWNAFRIECDPQSVLKTIEALDLKSADLREGVPYREVGALGSGYLKRRSGGSGSSSFSVTLQVDPEAVQLSRAEAEVVVGEIMQQPLSLEMALSKQAKDTITGTVLVTFETDAEGDVFRKTTFTKLRIEKPGGRVENDTAKQTIERSRLSAR